MSLTPPARWKTQVNERDEQIVAAELEFGDGPRRGDPEHHMSGTAMAATMSREPDGRLGIWIAERCEIDPQALLNASAKTTTTGRIRNRDRKTSAVAVKKLRTSMPSVVTGGGNGVGPNRAA